jgi:hypothetical protein
MQDVFLLPLDPADIANAMVRAGCLNGKQATKGDKGEVITHDLKLRTWKLEHS